MPGMLQGDGERSLRSSTSPFWFLYNCDDDVLQHQNAKVPTIQESGTTKIFVAVERIK